MRADRILRDLLGPCSEGLHNKRWAALVRFCLALLRGSRLTVTAVMRLKSKNGADGVVATTPATSSLRTKQPRRLKLLPRTQRLTPAQRQRWKRLKSSSPRQRQRKPSTVKLTRSSTCRGPEIRGLFASPQHFDFIACAYGAAVYHFGIDA